jgi:hypothetical protein
MPGSNAFGRVVKVLPHGESAESYATRCTRAVQSFLYGAPYWDKRDLATWLLEDYRPVAIELEPPSHRHGVERLTASNGSLLVAEGSLRDLLDRTCTELADALAEPELLVEQARLHRDLVAGVDAWGEELWIVASRPRMRLARRVASLAAAAGSYIEVPRHSGAFFTRKPVAISATAYRWTAGDR